MSELEPLDDDLVALVNAAKDVPQLDAARTAAIFAATSARIGAGGGGGGGGGREGEGEGGRGGDAGAGAGAGAGAVTKLGVAIALFVAGAGAGVLVDRAWLTGNADGSSVSVALAPAADRSAASPVAPPPLEAVSAASLPDAPRAGYISSGAHSRAAGAGSGSGSASASAEALSSRGLAAERALLDVARSALARGEAAEALAATERHAHEYPDGALVEEREALAIKALVALGRMGEARTRAHSLEQRFPNGLTIHAVKAAVGEDAAPATSP